MGDVSRSGLARETLFTACCPSLLHNIVLVAPAKMVTLGVAQLGAPMAVASGTAVAIGLDALMGHRGNPYTWPTHPHVPVHMARLVYAGHENMVSTLVIVGSMERQPRQHPQPLLLTRPLFYQMQRMHPNQQTSLPAVATVLQPSRERIHRQPQPWQ